MLKTGCLALTALVMTPSLASARAKSSSPIVQLREDAVPIDPARAKEMAPDELGDAVLAPGHPMVDETAVGPQGMDAPLPPTGPVATSIKLFLHPVANDPAGFCRRTEVALKLKLASRTPSGGMVPTPPEALTTRQAFRWIGNSKSEADCAAPRNLWLVPAAGEEAQALSLVRLVASLQRRAATRGQLPFELKIEDKMGSDMAASEREHPGQHWNTPPTVFTDGRAALAALPLGKTEYAGPSAQLCCNDLPFQWSAIQRERSLSASSLVIDLVWQVTLLFDGSKLVRMGVVREVPPPF